MAITRDQIYSAANTLNAQGVRPTLAGVRRVLGAGSFTTISESLNEWKLLQSAGEATNKLQEVPPISFIDRLNALGSSLWSEALTLATNRFVLEREAMDEKNREKEEYYKGLNDLTEEYDQELEGAKACIEQLRDEVSRANQRIIQLSEEAKQARQETIDAQREVKIVAERVMALQSELDRTHQKYESSQKGFINLTERLESMQELLLGKISQSKK